MITFSADKVPKHSRALLDLLAHVPAESLRADYTRQMDHEIKSINDLLAHCGGKPGILDMAEKRIIGAIRCAILLGGVSALTLWVQTARVSLKIEPGANPMGDAPKDAVDRLCETITEGVDQVDAKTTKCSGEAASPFNCHFCGKELEGWEYTLHPGLCFACRVKNQHPNIGEKP